MITGLVVALPEELTTLTQKKIAKGDFYYIDDKLIIAYSGAGAVNAEVASEQLIAKGVTRLISWGCAAALDDSLKSGDLVLADKLLDVKNYEFNVNVDWHNHVKETLTKDFVVNTGVLTESLGIVSSSKDKKKLSELTGAMALDMESIAIAKVAMEHNLPFLAIRVIADTVNMNLPLAINYSLNTQGEIVMKKLLFFLLLHPTELFGLIMLGLHFNVAKKTLRAIAVHLEPLTNFDLSTSISHKIEL